MNIVLGKLAAQHADGRNSRSRPTAATSSAAAAAAIADEEERMKAKELREQRKLRISSDST